MESDIFGIERTWRRIHRLNAAHKQNGLCKEFAEWGTALSDLCYICTYAEEEHVRAVALMLTWEEVAHINAGPARECVLDTLARIGGENEAVALKAFSAKIQCCDLRCSDPRMAAAEKKEISRAIRRAIYAIEKRR